MTLAYSLPQSRIPAVFGSMLRALLIGLLAVAIFGPLLNMLIWTVTEAWYFPAKLPVRWGFAFWTKVFRPEAGAMKALTTSVIIAVLTVALSLLVAIPAGYALSKRNLPMRSLFLLFFLLPQAFPTVAVHMNIARIFYGLGLTGTLQGLDKFLAHARTLLAPGGQILATSSDVRYLYEDEDGALLLNLNGPYYGEVTYTLSYAGRNGAEFPWLFIAAALLNDAAESAGYTADFLAEDENEQYLVRLQVS